MAEDVDHIECRCGDQFGTYPEFYEHVKERVALDETLHEIKEITTKTGGAMYRVEEGSDE